MRLIPVLLLLACVGAEDDAPADSGEEEGLIGADVPWPDKTPEEKLSWMTYAVRPNMEALFATHDPAYQGNFDCPVCHGTEVVSDFSNMPHTDGPPALSLSAWPTNDPDPAIRAMAEFMDSEVVPYMAALLSAEVATQANPDGVGCDTCHVITN